MELVFFINIQKVVLYFLDRRWLRAAVATCCWTLGGSDPTKLTAADTAPRLY